MTTQNVIDTTVPFSVPNGGTGITNGTAFGVVCSGTTSIGAFQVVSPGTAGDVFTSNGASSLPSFQTSPAGSAAAAFVRFTGSGTPTIVDSLNVSSVSHSSAANYHVNFTSSLASANYCTLVSFQPASGVNYYTYVYATISGSVTPTTPTTSGFDMCANDTGGGGAAVTAGMAVVYI